MWFRFPEGCHEIAIQGQNFVAEVEEAGREFFQAPEHFGGEILALNLGFSAQGPKDTSGVTPLETRAKLDESAALMAARIGQLEMENSGLRAQLAEAGTERDDLRVRMNELETEVKNLQFDLEQAAKSGG